MSEKTIVRKGLEGVIIDSTSVSKVMPEINSLTYRGYKVQDLCEVCSFEEVAHLLWEGELPTSAQLDAFLQDERSNREISNDLIEIMRRFPRDAHPMDALRTAVSFLGMEDEDTWASDAKSNLRKSKDLLAKIPTAIATFYRFRKGQDRIAPKSDLSMAANFFHMCFGEVPEDDVVKAFDVSLTLYAEHGFNASTFASRVVTSTQSDLHSAVVAGIGALKGPLHGGANEFVMHTLKEIDDPSKARDWMLTALKEKRKIMGFGHRVYKSGDSRVPTMKKYMHLVAKKPEDQKWVEISDILEKTMVDEKNIHPNLDFPAGPAYYMMGIDIDMFTPIFVMARITGWTAHIMEQTASNRIIRPLSEYEGHGERKVTAIGER